MTRKYFAEFKLCNKSLMFAACLVASLFVMLLIVNPSSAEIIDGPANVRVSPKGMVILFLNNGVPVKIISTQGDWYLIQIKIVLDKDPFLAEHKIRKDVILYDERGLEIGKTLNNVDIERRSQNDNKYIAFIEGYTFKTNIIIDSANPDAKSKIQTRSILKLAGGLSGEEYLLKGEPCTDCDGPGFSPVGFSAEEILKKYPHKEPKKNIVKRDTDFSSFIGQDRLAAKADCMYDDDENCSKFIVKLNRNNTEIFSILAGDNSPIDPIRALWTYRNHWFLEVARTINREVIEGNAHHVYTDVKGELIQDGDSINKRYGYQETFGSQLLNDNPFYFFMKNGRVGISFDGQETILDYNDVSHYRCCSYSVFNPKGFRNMVSFYGKKGDKWYYVAIGVF